MPTEAAAHEDCVAKMQRAIAFGRALPDGVIREVVTVEASVGTLHRVYTGTVGTLIALGVLTPPEL